MHPSQSTIVQEIINGNIDNGITPNIAMTANTTLAIANLFLVVLEKPFFSEYAKSASPILVNHQYTELINGNQSRNYRVFTIEHGCLLHNPTRSVSLTGSELTGLRCMDRLVTT